jgi:hypothetical protein
LFRHVRNNMPLSLPRKTAPRATFCFPNSSKVRYDTFPIPLHHSSNLFLILIFLASASIGMAGPPAAAIRFPQNGPTVLGNRAFLKGSQAYAPDNAPLAVKRAIWAANQLHAKPYRFGGGHHSFNDNAYDCSGTVSYMLAGAGLIKAPMSSSDLRKFGQQGAGRWITVYARNGHTFAIIAGLRLDTTPYITGHDKWAPRWQSTERKPAGFEARHPAGF